MAASERLLASASRSVHDGLNEYFDMQFALMNLSRAQIETQSLAELKVSLEQIDTAILHPEQFGITPFNLSGKLGAVVANSPANAHFTLGALPFLLARKRRILDRIRELTSRERLEEIKETIADRVNDPELQQELADKLTGYAREQESFAGETAKISASDFDLTMRSMEIQERKWRLRKSLLEREPVAVLVGGLILIALAASLIVGMFTRYQTPEILANAFLLILGFFFGQSSSSGIKQSADRTPGALFISLAEEE